MTAAICPACLRGKHSHDADPRTGGDAGCPMQGIPGDVDSVCSCPVLLPKVARHACPDCRCNVRPA